MKTEFTPGLAPLAAHYDAFVVDLWGTLHNGIEPLPGALDCLERLQAAGKGVALLSNAPFRTDVVVSVIDRIGVPRDLYDCVLSSGEMAWHSESAMPTRHRTGATLLARAVCLLERAR